MNTFNVHQRLDILAQSPIMLWCAPTKRFGNEYKDTNGTKEVSKT